MKKHIRLDGIVHAIAHDWDMQTKDGTTMVRLVCTKPNGPNSHTWVKKALFSNETVTCLACIAAK